MRAISLWQPYASAIAWELKRWETRGYPTSHRGLLAIHSTLHPPPQALELERRWIPRLPVAALPLGDDKLPRGCVLCTVRVCECMPTEQAVRWGLIGDQERELGDYGPGRFAYQLMLVQRFQVPIRARGARGWWHWEAA